jgi:hypothetical protein
MLRVREVSLDLCKHATYIGHLFFGIEFDDRMMEYKKGPMVARDGHPY